MGDCPATMSVRMRDVELLLSPTVHLTVPRLDGTIVPRVPAPTIARDSIEVAIDAAEFQFGSDSITRLMNDYVFTDGAPLHDIVVTTTNDGMHIDAKWGILPVWMDATVTLDRGAIRLHPVKMRPLNPGPLLGLIVGWDKAAENGVRVYRGDLVFELVPLMHKLIRLRGTLTGVSVANGGLWETFGGTNATANCSGCLIISGGDVGLAGHRTREGAIQLTASPRLTFSFPDAATACAAVAASSRCVITVTPCP